MLDLLILIFFSLAVFFVCYIYIPYCENASTALTLVFIAHVFSNIVFALAVYSVLIHFDESYVSAASAKAYRFQMIVSCFAPLCAGYLADYVGASLALCIFSGTGFLIAGIILFMNSRKQVIQRMKSAFNDS
jgi:cyanate permease